MRLVFVFVGWLMVSQLMAQLVQPARWEHELKYSDNSFSIISMRQEGLALMRDLEDIEGGKRKWELIFLDTALQQSWSTILLTEPEYSFLGYEHSTGHLNLMFRKQETEILKARIFDIELASKSVRTAETELKLQIRLTHYTATDGNCVFGGYVGMEPVLVIFDPAKNKNIMVPGFFLTETELLDVRPNKNGTFNVLLAQRIQGQKKMIFRTFDKYGNILVEDEIPIDEGKVILSGVSSVLEHDEVLIAGSFAFQNNRQASGIFSCLIDPFSEQSVQYTEFHQLQHFLDYLSDKKANKIRQKATQRENYNKTSEYKANVSIHRIEEFAGGFALFGETYTTASASSYANTNAYGNPGARYSSIPYSYYTPNNSRYYNNPYLYQPTPVAAELRLQQGFVVGFDYKGRRLWDYTIPMDELKAYSRDQVSDFVVTNNTPNFLYKEENNLKFSNHGTDTLQTGAVQTIPIRLNNSFEEDKSPDSEDGNVRQWYLGKFYVSGITTIKDSRPGVSNRRVFCINKVVLE
jgi:hypothetical protein